MAAPRPLCSLPSTTTPVISGAGTGHLLASLIVVLRSGREIFFHSEGVQEFDTSVEEADVARQAYVELRARLMKDLAWDTSEKPQCPKCWSLGLQVRIYKKDELVDSSSHSCIKTEFLYSNEFDIFWQVKAKKTHVRFTCSKCKHVWRAEMPQEGSKKL